MKTKTALGLLGLGAAYLAARALTHSHYLFRGKAVVITGGSRGLGLALGRRLAREGAHLAILARDAQELERAAADLRACGAEVAALQCDVRDEGALKHAIAEAGRRLGRIDVLINNAGEIAVGPLSTMGARDFGEAMAVHFWAPLHASFAALPFLRRQDEARIVNISSFGGKIAVPHMAPYSASKFALTGLSDAMRAELAGDGIAVTTVCPGLMRTGSHLNAFFKGERAREFTWFAIGAGLPTSSISADRAARQILSACRRGRPQLIITWQARLAVVAQALFPNTTAHLLALANHFLPEALPGAGREQMRGWESRSRWAPSLLTRLADRATERFNGLRGHAPVGR